MQQKILSSLRFFTIIALFGVFMFGYAMLPEDVLVFINKDGNPGIYITKPQFFYYGLAIMVFANGFILYSISNIKANYNAAEKLLSWYNVLGILMNLFFAISITFIGILNSRENYDYNNLGNLLYLSIGLLLMWCVWLIVLLIKTKNSPIK